MRPNVVVDKSYSFSVKIVRYCFEMQGKFREFVLTKQLLKSGTSVGANIEEAQGAISKAEFIAKIQISLKEAKETKYWLRLISDTNIFGDNQSDLLLKDINELIVLLTSILKSSKAKP